ncbi:MAG TPA: protein kinase [Kofleriaceae bacterium]
MQHSCPTCSRRFERPGFCPYDGTALAPAAAPDPPTLPSGEHPTQLDVRRRTFPLTPAPVVDTGELTSARGRPAPPAAESPRIRPPTTGPKIISRSASEDPSAALELMKPARSDYDKLIGQTLDGRYYVEKKIGEGGMGVVFSARHTVIERPLAIKVLKRDAMRDTATIQRFVQEAKAASRIGHPNIVDVTDFGTTPDGMTYSVMEFVPGQTLGAAIRLAAPFPAQRAIRITAQIARALAAAHDKGIVHRDLKPENVFLLDRDGRHDFVKIVDFGIAKVTPPSGQQDGPRLTRAGSVFGTPEYMAPEQAAGRSDTDGRVDIYALGVIFYEMICGKVPHRGDSMVRTLAMQMLDPILPPSQVRPDLTISPELEAVILRALAKKRDQRYQTMTELLEALDTLLPQALGQSVTGSPVYELAALPPGADPAAYALPAVAVSPSEAASHHGAPVTGSVAEARPVTPVTRRPRDEPEFTAGGKPPTFEHVFDDEAPPARARRWPVLMGLALMAGAAAGAAAVVVKSRHHAVVEPPRDAGVPDSVGDAELADALVPVVPDDASEPPAPDDAARVIRPPHDASDPDHDHDLPPGPNPDPIPGPGPKVPWTPNHRGTILVSVVTEPDGGILKESGHFRGPSGTQLEEPLGTQLTVTCHRKGYKDGRVTVRFDGKTYVATCTMQRIKICAPGIKNPFDECVQPDGPALPPLP